MEGRKIRRRLGLAKGGEYWRKREGPKVSAEGERSSVTRTEKCVGFGA